MEKNLLEQVNVKNEAEARAVFVNLTPHAVTIAGVTFEPTGLVARCVEYPELITRIGGIPIMQVGYGQAENLPPVTDKILIVSAMVRMAYPERIDLVSPGALVRNAQGQIIGCEYLIANKRPDAECL